MRRVLLLIILIFITSNSFAEQDSLRVKRVRRYLHRFPHPKEKVVIPFIYKPPFHPPLLMPPPHHCPRFHKFIDKNKDGISDDRAFRERFRHWRRRKMMQKMLLKNKKEIADSLKQKKNDKK